MPKYRIHFIDKGQKLTHVDVRMKDQTGIIVALPRKATRKDRLLMMGNTVRSCDLVLGNKFEFEKDGFAMETTHTILTKTKITRKPAKVKGLDRKGWLADLKDSLK